MSLREQLQGIYDQHGSLTPRLIVDDARDPKHPLHERFEWDDSVAGEAWRRHQAHELITTVRIIRHSGEGEVSVRAFHAVRREAEENGGYVYEPAEVVIADPFLTKLVMGDMERDWKTLLKRYEDFREFWEMVAGDVGEVASG